MTARPLDELEELLEQLLVVVYDEHKPVAKRLAAAEAWWAIAGEVNGETDAPLDWRLRVVGGPIVEVGLALCAWRSGQDAQPEFPPTRVARGL